MAQSAEQAYTHNVYIDRKCYQKRRRYRQDIVERVISRQGLDYIGLRLERDNACTTINQNNKTGHNT